MIIRDVQQVLSLLGISSAGRQEEKEMIRVCYYKQCGVVYGEKAPLSDKRTTHGLCPKHLRISLREIKDEMGKEEGRKKSWESF